MNLKLLNATVIVLSLLAAGCAHTNKAGDTSDPGLVEAPNSQSIRITRSGSQPSRRGPAENFAGSVRVDPLFQTNASTRTSGSLVKVERGKLIARWN